MTLRTRRRFGWPTLLLLLAGGFLAGSAAAIEVIVARDAPVSALTRNEARALFTMRKTRWPNGQAARVFVLDENGPAHEVLCKEVLDLYPWQVREAVDRGIYTGVGQAPTRVASEEEMKQRVAATPGAIVYVTSLMKNDHVRSIPVR